MKTLRALRRRIGIFAPEVIVKPRLPWQLRLPGLALFAVILAGTGWGLFEAGRQAAGAGGNGADRHAAALAENLTRVEAQVSELRAQLTARERQIQVEQETQNGLAQQVKALQADNLRLKEDLALFETLLARRTAAEPLSLLQFKVERGAAPGEYRYRFLVAQGAGGKRFQGHYEFLIRGRRSSGERTTEKWSGAGKQAAEANRLNFQHYQRAEGIVRVAPDIQVTEIELSIYESGSAEAKLSQTASPT